MKLCIVIKVCHSLYRHFGSHNICFNDVRIGEEAHIPYRGVFCYKARRLEGSHHEGPVRVFLVVSINYRELNIIILKLISKSGVKSLWLYLKKNRVFNTNKEPNWRVFRLPSWWFLKYRLCFHLWNIEFANLDAWFFRSLYFKVFTTARHCVQFDIFNSSGIWKNCISMVIVFLIFKHRNIKDNLLVRCSIEHTLSNFESSCKIGILILLSSHYQCAYLFEVEGHWAIFRSHSLIYLLRIVLVNLYESIFNCLPFCYINSINFNGKIWSTVLRNHNIEISLSFLHLEVSIEFRVTRGFNIKQILAFN